MGNRTFVHPRERGSAGQYMLQAPSQWDEQHGVAHSAFLEISHIDKGGRDCHRCAPLIGMVENFGRLLSARRVPGDAITLGISWEQARTRFNPDVDPAELSMMRIFPLDTLAQRYQRRTDCSPNSA